MLVTFLFFSLFFPFFRSANHPNICKVYEYIFEGGIIVMDLVRAMDFWLLLRSLSACMHNICVTHDICIYTYICWFHIIKCMMKLCLCARLRMEHLTSIWQICKNQWVCADHIIISLVLLLLVLLLYYFWWDWYNCVICTMCLQTGNFAWNFWSRLLLAWCTCMTPVNSITVSP